LAGSVSLAGGLVLLTGRVQAAPGGHTPAQVAAATAAGVAYIDAQQNPDGSFGTTAPEAETGFALVAYGVLANNTFASLPAAYQPHVKKAITWLLGQQNTTAPSVGGMGGSWSAESATYDTGIVLSGLSAFASADPGIPAALTNGRAYLVNTLQAPPLETCSSADPPDATASFCGGWNYDEGTGRSDESNTGFALTGLQLSGGVPAAVSAVNVGWQHHIQEIASNPLATRNDGGGDYMPGETGDFSSNANDTGSMLFGLGFDGVPGTDPHVQAGLKLADDVLDVYEMAAPASRTMVFHTGMTEDGACVPGVGACDWSLATGEGGFHYSLFALTKGIGEFVAPSLTDPTNWYAKVVDLLLNEQGTDGSWPDDGRDDASTLFATELSVGALGLVAVPPPTTTTVAATTTTTPGTTTTMAGATTTTTMAGATTTTTVAGATTTTVAGATTTTVAGATTTTVAGATTTTVAGVTTTTVAGQTTTTTGTAPPAATTSTTAAVSALSFTGSNRRLAVLGALAIALGVILLLLATVPGRRWRYE
jgi:hypothetical protein